MMKKIIVGGVLLAAYEVDTEKNIIFLKVFAKIPGFTIGKSEDFYHAIICAACGVWIDNLAYYNIRKEDVK